MGQRYYTIETIKRLEDLLRAATARADRAEDGLAKVEAIADAFVSDPGCEINVVQKVEEMGHMIQRLRSDIHEIDRMLTAARKI